MELGVAERALFTPPSAGLRFSGVVFIGAK